MGQAHVRLAALTLGYVGEMVFGWLAAGVD